MSNNGYVVPHLKGPETASTANLFAESGIRNSARVHLNGNVARRIVKGREFFWWDIELHGFGLRSFRSGKKCWFVQLRQRGKQKRITLGHPGDMTADQARAPPSGDVLVERNGPSASRVLASAFTAPGAAFTLCKP